MVKPFKLVAENTLVIAHDTPEARPQLDSSQHLAPPGVEAPRAESLCEAPGACAQPVAPSVEASPRPKTGQAVGI
jgi:hypothetical protein